MENSVTSKLEQAGKADNNEHTPLLYVRQVPDKRLPAAEVLPEIGQARGSRGPVPLFVP